MLQIFFISEMLYGPANYKCSINLVTLIHVCPATSVTKIFEKPSRKPYQKQLALSGGGGASLGSGLKGQVSTETHGGVGKAGAVSNMNASISYKRSRVGVNA